jgi:hypothetical protein
MKPDICKNCSVECETPCAAYEELHHVYDEMRTEARIDLIRRLRALLNIADAEPAEDLEELGRAVIDAMPELGIIPAFDIKIGYVRNWQRKVEKGGVVHADCRKVNRTYGAYLPFDFIVTFYEPNIIHLSENQKKILMLHELRHIKMGERGLALENHDVEDFSDILSRFGINWSWMDKEVPDILQNKL